MMFRIFTFFFLFICSISFAQKDLIVTQAGEEIRCKILEETSMRYAYAYINDRNEVVRTEIFKTLVSTFKKDYYPTDLMPNAKLFKSDSGTKNKEKSTKKKVVDSPEIILSKESSTDPVLLMQEKKENSKVEDQVNSTKIDNDQQNQKISKLNKKDAKKIKKEENAKLNEEEAVLNSIEPEQDIPNKEVPVLKERTIVSPDSVPTVENVKPVKNEFTNYLKYRIGVKGGLANLMKVNTDKTEYGLYNERLSRGGFYGVDVATFLNDYIGLGLTYTSFQVKNSNDWFDFPRAVSQEVKTGSLKDKVSHRFVGPTLLGRVPLDYKTFLVATASPGYFFYQNKRMEDDMNINIKGKTLGLATTLGIDFLIGDDNYGRDVIISFECGYNYGMLTELNYGGTIGTQKLASPMDLSRLDFSIGLRFNRFPRFLK